MSLKSLVSTPGSAGHSLSRDSWYLVGCLPPIRSLTRIRIHSPTFIVGRKPDCHLSVRSQCVSARHAEIIQIDHHLFLRDLGSTNGTYLNRQAVGQLALISDGDHIQIADVEFRVEYRLPAAWVLNRTCVNVAEYP